jgi:GDP-L-fucose synthase
LKLDKVFVAGHNGMVGSALVRQLQAGEHCDLLLRDSKSLDLRNQQAVQELFAAEKPDIVYLAAARVGGILANNENPADFIYENLMIAANVINAAHRFGVKRLLFLGSSCIYPRLAEQPMQESALLTGPLEPTNEPYAIAKIAGIKLCESYNRQFGCDFRSAMPTNLYGPGDNFHPLNSHVLPALMRRFHEAMVDQADTVTVWGTGNAKREFLHVDDLAAACVHLMALDQKDYQERITPQQSHINIGTGLDCSIGEVARTIAEITGFKGKIKFDASKPDGAPRKLLDVSLLAAMGWQAQISLADGLQQTYQWFRDHVDTVRT